MEHAGGYRNERIEEWMEQQEVSSDASFNACCDPQSVKRRKARYVLYKQLVLEEIDKRCRKYEDDLLPEEKEAIEEVKEKFSRGNYGNIHVSYNFVGTFYTPLTIILSLIYPRVLFPILFPMSYLIYWMICIMRLKDNGNACKIYTSFIICILLILFTGILFIDIFNVLFCFPFVFSISLLVELIMLATSIVFCYGFKYLFSHGVLHYRFQISLIEIGMIKIQNPLYNNAMNNVIITANTESISRTIRHAPFRRLYSRPILKIFHSMDISSYDFGEINGQLVTQDGINSYITYSHL
uniref:Uncharacterized protein n=1 Tax=Amphimedon queenslandica TaxID=400682 RepID=A0A1X7U8W5_AMPQE